jgi:phage terminase small subunit
MARNKTPTAILDAKGAFIVNPERKRPNEPTTNRPLGKPPKWMSKAEKKVWKELAAQALPGVVMESDRLLFALMVRIAAKLYRGEALMVGEMSQLISLGSRFAMTPADRSKVSVEKPEASALDRFMARKSEPRKDTDVLQ